MCAFVTAASITPNPQKDVSGPLLRRDANLVVTVLLVGEVDPPPILSVESMAACGFAALWRFERRWPHRAGSTRNVNTILIFVTVIREDMFAGTSGKESAGGLLTVDGANRHPWSRRSHGCSFRGPWHWSSVRGGAEGGVSRRALRYTDQRVCVGGVRFVAPTDRLAQRIFDRCVETGAASPPP